MTALSFADWFLFLQQQPLMLRISIVQLLWWHVCTGFSMQSSTRRLFDQGNVSSEELGLDPIEEDENLVPRRSLFSQIQAPPETKTNFSICLDTASIRRGKLNLGKSGISSCVSQNPQVKVLKWCQILVVASSDWGNSVCQVRLPFNLFGRQLNAILKLNCMVSDVKSVS